MQNPPSIPRCPARMQDLPVEIGAFPPGRGPRSGYPTLQLQDPGNRGSQPPAPALEPKPLQGGLASSPKRRIWRWYRSLSGERAWYPHLLVPGFRMLLQGSCSQVSSVWWWLPVSAQGRARASRGNHCRLWSLFCEDRAVHLDGRKPFQGLGDACGLTAHAPRASSLDELGGHVLDAIAAPQPKS